MTDPILRLHHQGLAAGTPNRKGEARSQRWMQELRVPRWVLRRLVAADVSDQELVTTCTVTLVVVVLVSPTLVVGVDAGVGVVTAMLGLAIPLILVTRLRARRRTRVAAAVAPLLEATARSLRGGMGYDQALRFAVGSAEPCLATALAGLLAKLDKGLPHEEAFEYVADEKLPELNRAAVMLSTVATAQAGSAAALESGATAIRSQALLAEEASALAAQAKASSTVLGALPLLVVAAWLMAGSESAAVLWTAPFGRLCLAAGVVLESIGFVWMRSMIAASLR